MAADDETERDDGSEPGLARSGTARVAWAGLGVACVGVGAVGVVVPGLPTIPFLLLATACFARGSRRLHARLLAHRTFGPLIREYRAGRGVSARVKVVSLGTMWVFVALALGPGIPDGLLGARAVVALVALLGTIILLRLPTRRPD